MIPSDRVGAFFAVVLTENTSFVLLETVTLDQLSQTAQ